MQVKQRDIPKVGISVLGPLSLDERRSVGRRDRIVLSALVLQHGHPVSADLLTDVLWPDGPPASASKIVQGCIVRLRSELGPESIRTTDHGYLLGETGKDLDVVKFEEGVARGRELIALGQYDRAAYTFAEALQLWRGRPYPDLESLGRRCDRDRSPRRTQAAGRGAPGRGSPRERGPRRRAGHGTATGGRGTAEGTAVDAARDGGIPSRTAERRARGTSTLSRDAARRARHRPQPRGHRARARHPEPGSWAARGRAGSPEADACPWLGLSSYDADDAAMFFGRESEIASAMTQLRGRGVLAVVGPSGSRQVLVRARRHCRAPVRTRG